ncbi:MAG: PD40 domain-containing protein [Myxococcales bacterium]|nr:PD40 domain-containing protein [Myxococcales bacterium]
MAPSKSRLGPRARVLALCAALVAATGFALSSCGGEDTTGTATGTGASAAAGGSGGSGNSGLGGNLFGGHDPGNPAVSIQIDPQNPTLTVENGALPAPLHFTATGLDVDGNPVPVVGSWSFDRFDVASIGAASGDLTATGVLGGVGTVTFQTPSIAGTTSATVKIRITADPQAVDPGIKSLFASASQPDPSMALVYPYDKTVFPRGLPGPIVQWNGGGAADIYRVFLHSPTFELESFSTVPPPSRFTMPSAPQDVWRVLTDSTAGAITLDVQRYDGAQAYLAKTQTWTIAPAVLTGVVYYWSIQQGAIVRIPIGASAPETFLQVGNCVACHSVSAKGNRIAASRDGGWSPWMTFDAASGQALFDSGVSSGFEAISPDGEYLLWRHWSDGAFNSTGALALSAYNSTTELATLAPNGGAPAHPAWSPDGHKIAFSQRTDGNGLVFTQASLWYADVSLSPPGFSNVHPIVANDAARPTVTYPTFSPGSDWIAFMRANNAYCNSPSVGYPVLGDIWLSSLDGASQIKLDALNGAGYLSSPDDSLNYQPSFLPVAQGGYMWIVISTERNYGNMIEYAPGDYNSRAKQLWVAAVDANPQPGVDPSHPAFWLPGQELGLENMRGQWALAPCKQLGDTCQAGYECCDGFCHDDGNGNLVCSDQPGGCAQDGELCQTAADCCDPNAQCLGGFCTSPPPG